MKNLILKTTLVSILVMLIFFACKREDPIPPTIVEGKVVDFKTGKLIPNVEVRLFKYSTDDFEKRIRYNFDNDYFLIDRFPVDMNGNFRFAINSINKQLYYYLNLYNDSLVSNCYMINLNKMNKFLLETKDLSVLKLRLQDTTSGTHILEVNLLSDKHLNYFYEIGSRINIDTTIYCKVVKNEKLKYSVRIWDEEINHKFIYDSIILPNVDTAELYLPF